MCSSAGRATVSKAVGRGFESLRTRLQDTHMSHLKPISDLQSEFKKVTWLTKAELLQQSRIVLTSILFVGFLVYAADIIVQSTLALVLSLLKWIVR